MCLKFFCCHKFGSNAVHSTTDNDNDEEVSTPVIVQPILSGYYNLFAKECLDEHNRLRSRHGVPMVTLNVELSAYAAEWARNLADRNTVLVYRNDGIYGENLFVAREYNVDARTVVRSWYDEIHSYNFDRPERVHGVDQFTQVVWKDTKEIGVGIVRSKLNTWIVVNYDPMGNKPGRFEANVIRPLDCS